MVRLNDSFEYDFYFGASATTKALAAELRKNMTYAEKVFWQQLRNRKLGNLKFRRQHPVDIFILDFYCHEKNLPLRLMEEFTITKHKRNGMKIGLTN